MDLSASEKEIRRILYNPLLDLLRLLENLNKFKQEFKKLVHNYAVLKTELIYVNQKSFTPLNTFGLNENYLERSRSNITDKTISTESLIMEKLDCLREIVKEIYSIEAVFSDLLNNPIINEVMYNGIIGNGKNSISVDIIIDFISNLRDCVESDLKIQESIIKLMKDLKGYHVRNIQGCLGFFQSSYCDYLDKEELFLNVKKAIREFIT